MIAELSSRRALSTEVVKRVSERAGGVPLFIEEVTRSFSNAANEGAPQAIPPTLRQSLAARLDRLGTGARSRADRRSVGAQLFLCSSARRRSHGGVAPAYGGSTTLSLQSALARLVERRPSFRRRRSARGDLSLQACADSGRGLRQPFERPPSGAAPTRSERR